MGGWWTRFCEFMIGLPAYIRDWASAGRDVLALLFTPVNTAVSVFLICILAGWFTQWGQPTEIERIRLLGVIAVIYAMLVGFGGQWFQRNRLEKLKFSAGKDGISGEVDAEAETTQTTTKTTKTTELQVVATEQISEQSAVSDAGASGESPDAQAEGGDNGLSTGGGQPR